mgnify:CR=1 FL=1
MLIGGGGGSVLEKTGELRGGAGCGEVENAFGDDIMI